MSKFKVGDKVRATAGLYEGQEFVIESVHFDLQRTYAKAKTAHWGVYFEHLVPVPGFKVGDRVRIVDASEGDTYHGSYKVGDEFVITRLDNFSSGFAEGKGFEGGVWFRYLEPVPAEPEFKEGDRVKVEYEAEVDFIYNSGGVVVKSPSGYFNYHAPSELTKVKPRIPTAFDAVIKIDGKVFHNVLPGVSKFPWNRTQSNNGFTDERVQELADMFGFTVLHEGNKDA